MRFTEKEIGAALVKALTENGISEDEFIRDAGISSHTWDKWRAGTNLGALTKAAAIADAAGTTPNKLLGYPETITPASLAPVLGRLMVAADKRFSDDLLMSLAEAVFESARAEPSREAGIDPLESDAALLRAFAASASS